MTVVMVTFGRGSHFRWWLWWWAVDGVGGDDGYHWLLSVVILESDSH